MNSYLQRVICVIVVSPSLMLSSCGCGGEIFRINFIDYTAMAKTAAQNPLHSVL